MCVFFFFFFNDTATTEIYTLSLHDALPIYIANNLANVSDGYSIHAYWNYWNPERMVKRLHTVRTIVDNLPRAAQRPVDRKSTRLNSSHDQISYAVFCLKKKNNRANVQESNS